MTRTVTARLVVIVLPFVLAAISCSSGGGSGPVTSFDPFETDPAGPGGQEPTVGADDAAGPPPIQSICARACAHIEEWCPGAAGGSDCPSECESAAARAMSCLMLFKRAVVCFTNSPLSCVNKSAASDACAEDVEALRSCYRTLPPAQGGPASPVRTSGP